MERLDKLINILKLTPHRQPELVKEATHRILNRSFRYDVKIKFYLKHTIEILLKYCDSDDGVQRSLFNDYLNSVILAFQDHCYQIILHVLVEEISNNGSVRTVTAALTRLPLLINNVQPIELGYDSQKLLKSLIEISRRAQDESVQKALHLTLEQVMPYLDYSIKQSKEALFLAKTLVENLLLNLSSPTKRNAVLALKSLYYSHSQSHRNVILTKLEEQLDSLSCSETSIDTNKFAGFCLAIKEIPDFAEQYSKETLRLLFKQIIEPASDSITVVSALEAAREILLRVRVREEIFKDRLVETLVERFLVFVDDKDTLTIRTDTKVILQANTLALISAIIQQQPTIIHSNTFSCSPKSGGNDGTSRHPLLDRLLLFKDHSDVAVRNQVYYLIGNYMAASWRFPQRDEYSPDCEQVKNLWYEFRKALNDDTTHPDVLKSCLISINLSINALLNSDHCVHIVEYEDLERLIHLYSRSNFKPLKVEVLNLFAKLDYLTLCYLELYHWSYYRSKLASSFVDCIQVRILSDVMINSLTDESQIIRSAASSALLSIIPNLHIMSETPRSCDPIISLASDLAGQQSVIFEQATNQMNLTSDNISTTNLRPNEEMVIRNEYKILSSSILREKFYDEQCNTPSHEKRIVSVNLRLIINLLRFSLDNSLEKGKVAVLSIARTLLKLSKSYPIHQYPSSWDCRPSEHCDCYILLNLLLTYLENLTEPDIIIEDLDAYQTFLALSSHLLYALCHESVFYEYENQRMKPYYKRNHSAREHAWSDLTIKYAPIADILQVYYSHLVKLLWLLSYVVEEKSNPFAMTSKTQQQQMAPDLIEGANHSTLIANRFLFGRIHKKLESSYKSSKKNLRKVDEKFHIILDTCLAGISSLSEFMSTNQSKNFVRSIVSYLKITSSINSVSSLVCARQLLKSLFGINIIALYQVDPLDWFEEEDTSYQRTRKTDLSNQEKNESPLNGVYHHLVSNPYKIFSEYLADNCSQITPGSDKALAAMDFESRRTMRVRFRIEEIVKSLFEFHPNQLVSPRVREVSELLKSIIAEFTPIVMECMRQFNHGGFCQYQAEVLHFMSYLILLRVNYQKLPLAEDFISSIHKMLDSCGERKFLARDDNIELILRNSFTFLTLLTYERGPSKAMFQVATIIQKFDDIRAKLSTTSAGERDVTVYVVPLLRCLIEDLFIYRTEHFQKTFLPKESVTNIDTLSTGKIIQNNYDYLEAERETIAQKLLDIIENPGAYDLLSIIILESRLNSDGTKYEKLSQRLYLILPDIYREKRLELANFRRLELTKRILENISTEVFKPVTFIIKTLLETPIPSKDISSRDFQRWMSLAVIDLHILTTQVKEDKFLARISETMNEKLFIEYLFHVIQLCAAEIFISHTKKQPSSFLVQLLAYYIHYMTYMFQSGLFFQLSKSAPELVTAKNQVKATIPKKFGDLCHWARDSGNEFSLLACETIFFHLRYSHPDLTIMWCNLMMLLNNVDCNSDFWCNLLIYDCYHCQTPCCSGDEGTLDINSGDTKSALKRGRHVNRPSSLNLLDISFNDQLRRSFIKKIATSESRPRTYEQNPVDTKIEGEGDDVVEFEKFGQCLAPNVELSRRGALCLVLDYVSISMNDVEHITWLIIHHINDIIRWSHEMPIAEFINAVHGNSASSGIFIQAIDTNVNDLTSFSFVTRLLHSLEKVHYTQYGSLVVLLVEKLLSSTEIMPYRALTKDVETFACEAVQKLLNDTNKSLVTTNEEIINQLTSDDLDRISAMLDSDLYSELTQLLIELRNSCQGSISTPTVELCRIQDDSDEEPEEKDEIDSLYSKAYLIYWHAEEGYTAHMSTLLPAIDTVKSLLSKPEVAEKVNCDETLVCFLVSSVYSLILTILPPPTRLSRPRSWLDSEQSNSQEKATPLEFTFEGLSFGRNPVTSVDSRRTTVKPAKRPVLPIRSDRPKSELIEEVRLACLEGLFLFNSIDWLRAEQFSCVDELIIRLARLPLINPFILTPPDLWKRNVWPTCFDAEDEYKINFPLVPHDILSKDYGLLKDFCDRILKLGWTSRRQFEEAWNVLIGVLSTTSSQSDQVDIGGRENSIDLCKLVIMTLTRYLTLTRKSNIGDPLAVDLYPAQSFDERVVSLVKSIRTNLSSLKNREVLDSSDSNNRTRSRAASRSSICGLANGFRGYNDNLKIPAQKLRMNSILNIMTDLHESVSDSKEDQQRRKNYTDDVDVESCIRSILSIYNNKLNEPQENLIKNSQENSSSSTLLREHQMTPNKATKNQQNQLAPPLVTAIIQSILSLSDMFADYEQYFWLFETFMNLFKIAERNEDEIQMQYLILGLCKATTICCYELPKDLITATSVNYNHELMFEKCRQSIERCLRSDLLTLKQNAFHGAFYMLEDSINIVASGAWDLDDFERLRQSRWNWIRCLVKFADDRKEAEGDAKEEGRKKKADSSSLPLPPPPYVSLSLFVVNELAGFASKTDS